VEEDKEKGIPKDIFEKDPRIRIVGEEKSEEKRESLPAKEKASEKKESIELKEERKEEIKEAAEEEPVGTAEEEVSVEEGEKEKEKEQKVVEVEESLEQLVSAPTIETPTEEARRGEATYYEFKESEEGLKKIEVGEVVTYGTETLEESYQPGETRGLIFWAALGTVIFLIFLGLLIISFLLRL
jgi:vacuolar-type H+-ATPase subunit I/STV1